MLARSYRNLISCSSLSLDLEAFLRERRGTSALEEVCREILLTPALSDELAGHLVAAMIGDDPRFVIDGNRIQLREETAEEIWARQRSFAVVDVETTTGGAHSLRIIEVAVCRLSNGQMSSWSSLVNPGRPIARWISEMTGITDATVAGAPRFEEIAGELLDRLEDAIIVAHHARFDMSCLSSELERAFSKRLANRYLCTVELARHFLPGPENYRLETISRYLRLIHERPHRAWSDAQTTANLFRELEARAGDDLARFLRPRGGGRAGARRARAANGIGQDR